MVALVERCARYMLMVQYKYCSAEVYPDYDDAFHQAK
jgi:hypothetical protein